MVKKTWRLVIRMEVSGLRDEIRLLSGKLYEIINMCEENEIPYRFEYHLTAEDEKATGQDV